MNTGLNMEMELTGIVVPDIINNQFSAFFAQFPEAIAYGDTIEDAQNKLVGIFTVMLQDRKTEVIKGYVDHVQYTATPYKMTIA